MDSLLADLRFAFRMLRRSPAFTLAAVLSLALGIGANTALFSVVDALLFRPLPYPDADRLVMVWQTDVAKAMPQIPPALPDIDDFRQGSAAFDRLGHFHETLFTLTGLDVPERLRGVEVSPELLDVLQIRPLLGRAFSAEEFTYDRHQVALISNGLWRRRFAATPEVLGRTLSLNGKPYTVIGVMPPGFDFPRRDDLWVPMSFPPGSITPTRFNHFARVLGRLKPDATVARAQRELSAVAERLSREIPTNKTLGVSVRSLRDDRTGEVRTGLLVLLAAVAFVLLIACANLISLLLARATHRQREISVRAALGASRGRLVRQLLTEALLLSAVGGLGGMLLATWGVEAFRVLGPAELREVADFSLDARVLAFALGITGLTGVGFGLLPALAASRPSLIDSLKGGSGITASARGQRLRSALVAAEVAVSLVLLVGAGLLIRSFAALQAVDLAFQPEQVLTFQLDVPAVEGFSDDPAKLFDSISREQAQTGALLARVDQRLRMLAGVDRVGAISSLPMSETHDSKYVTVEGKPLATSYDQVPVIRSLSVSGEYFSVLGVGLIRGRFFEPTDSPKSAPVVVLNQVAARLLFGEEPALGRRLWMGPPESLLPVGVREALRRSPAGGFPRATVVGIARDVPADGVDQPVPPQIYVLQGQALEVPRTYFFTLKTSRDPALLIPEVRRAMAEVAPELPVGGLEPFEARLGEAVARPRFQMVLLGVFAGVALVLAMIGVHGVMGYAVSRRTHEFAIRMALGAEASDVLWQVLRQGAALVGIGLALGLVGALATGQVLRGLLFAVSATDAGTYVAVVVLLAAAALLALYSPVRRATRVDPATALRAE